MVEQPRSTRSALVEALAAEHRLRRQALHEQQEVTRWRQRADFARERGLVDLAAEAEARAQQHERRGSMLATRAEEMRQEVELLRAPVSERSYIGRSPPPADPLEARFADLEVERDLDEMRNRHAGNAAPRREFEPRS
jgi:hypothetical protein